MTMLKSFLQDGCHSYHYRALILTMLVAITLSIFPHTTDAQTGVCYGTLGGNLPPPGDVVALLKQHNISRIRIYDPNPSILQALSNNPSSISVVVGVANQDIPGIASDPNLARSWVQNNILQYPNVNFKYIAVGNEISPLDSMTASIASSVLPAMHNIYAAVSASRLADRIKVSTALKSTVLGSSYPPSAGAFHSEIQSSYIIPIVQFLVQTQSPFLANVYPYFAYTNQPQDIRLDYALFTATSAVVTDGQYQYRNLFSAIVDAFNAALDKVGGANVEVVVAETGWPTAGGTAAGVENAQTYNSRLIEYVKNGTPRRAGKPIEVYVFDLIDEDQKNPPEYERHWGLFLPNQHPKYPLSFT